MPCGQHLEGLFARDVTAERHHRGGAEKADVDAIDAKARAMRRHGHVATGHQLTARCRGDAMRGGNDGLGQGADRGHHPGAARKEICEIGAPAILCLSPGCHLLEIVARAKRLAGALDRDHADAAILCQPVEFGLKGRQHRIRERVEIAGRIEREPGDCALVGAVENCHLVTPCALWPF